MTRFKPVWNDSSISLSSKILLMRPLIASIFLHACESWTLTVELQRRIQDMEMRCYRKILRCSYKDHLTNGPCLDPAGTRTTRRPDHRKETQTALVWLCLPFIKSGQNHLARHSERGQKTRRTKEEVGRQHQGLEFGKSQRAVENRGK